MQHAQADNQPSLQARVIARGLRRLVKPRQVSRADISLLRALMTAMTRSRLPEGISAERVRAPVRGEWLRPARPRRGRVLFYFHGGGFFCGSPQTHRAITGRLARHLECPVFSLDYRLAPEHPYPAALDDALAAWRWLLGGGHRPDRIWLGGDSAGGGLALALMLACKRHGLPQPAGALLFSPWTDLTCSSPSIAENTASCAWFMPEQVRFAAGLYAGGAAMGGSRNVHARPAPAPRSLHCLRARGRPGVVVDAGSNRLHSRPFGPFVLDRPHQFTLYTHTRLVLCTYTRMHTS